MIFGGSTIRPGPKTFNIVIFSDTINVINVKFCMMMLLTEFYLFMPLSVTLTVTECHSSVKQFENVMCSPN